MNDSFEHFNLNEVDPTFKPIDPKIYGLRVNKFEYKIVQPKSGKRVGEDTPLVNANFTVINDDTFSGRRLRHTFWMLNPYDQKAVRRLAENTGLMQEADEPFEEYCKRFASQNPPVEFRTYVGLKELPGKNEKGESQYDNEIKWNQVFPIA